MKRMVASLLSLVAIIGCAREEDASAKAPHAAVAPCATGQLAGSLQAAEAVSAHRGFARPVISYPAGTALDGWGFDLELLVRDDGSVACYLATGMFDQVLASNPQRSALFAAIAQWHYRPFVDDHGRAVQVRVRDPVWEQRLPATHRQMPDAGLSTMSFTLQRTGCYGTCPAYKVTVGGDGRVVYEGGAFVDVMGRHAYRIPVSRVQSLVDLARSSGLWSMEDQYTARITDNPTQVITLQAGGEHKRIIDYAGAMVGMPMAVDAFEQEIDRIADVHGLVALSTTAVARLREEGFAFDSQDGADLLRRAVNNQHGHDEQAMLQLLELGAPVSGGRLNGRDMPGPSPGGGTLLDEALDNGRGALIGRLLDRGLLQRNDRHGMGGLDTAFQSAVRGGRLQAVQRIWEAAGPGLHPSLEATDLGAPGQRRIPVTLLLRKRYGDAGWEGLAIAQWLAARGCDVKARSSDGNSLLHIATNAGDLVFVQWLLGQGVDPSLPGPYGLPALAGAEDEDIALLLLHAGSDWKMNDNGAGFLRYARGQHWERVLSWLQVNGQVSKDDHA